MTSACGRLAGRGAVVGLALVLLAGPGWPGDAGTARASTRALPPPPPVWQATWGPLHDVTGLLRPRPGRPGVRPPRPAHPHPVSARVLRLVNEERARAGCPGVRFDRAVARAAQRHSVHMARTRTLAHEQPAGADPGRRLAAEGYRWKRVGETIARGQRSPAGVVRAWMHSAEHRTPLTTCAYRDAGVGISRGARGPWWTLLLASPCT
ncbi:CAP domain-containing protein [Streptomyces albus]|uniref:CAP domain-containing protein n=1 Tax=Streptomyces albus TaxID=1888 RepID=UPI0024E0D187|nr:CAP domain-containing protein [Streptomyces albus]